MQRVKVLLFVTLFLCSGASYSQGGGLSLNELKKYTSILGGYGMEEKCRFGEDDRFSDFRLSLQAIGKSFVIRGVDQEYIRKLIQDSKKVANVTPYSKCGEEAKRVVAMSYNSSWAWANEIITNKQDTHNKNNLNQK